jgi:hypothetical protein
MPRSTTDGVSGKARVNSSVGWRWRASRTMFALISMPFRDHELQQPDDLLVEVPVAVDPTLPA